IGNKAGDTAQRVNINTAELWLLTALPGIGESRAQAVIDYREENGFFRDTREITSVEGIGDGLYAEIHDLITVAE
ncbi:MAG: ComEA family DNA-binding protein, partial [Dehalococcoidales bacterium]|nr:ComEA family DNA-binding protein [Dehalococcoidales bacterium]